MRRTLTLCVAVLAVVIAFQAEARADEHCDVIGERYSCRGGGGGGGSDPTPPGDPWLTYTKGWESWNTTTGICVDGFSPRVIRFMQWTDGPLDGTRVDRTQFGGVTSTNVPNAPTNWNGTPARFAADGLVYDIVCTTPDTDEWWLYVVGIIEDPSVTLNPHTLGVTGIDTWFWYDGNTTDGPIAATYTDAVTGITYAIEIRAAIDQFEWDTGDGNTYTRTEPGSDANLPATAAVTHVYETKAIYDVTITVRWTAEVRVDVGAGWTPWAPIPGSYEPSVTLTYPVSEIVTRITG